MSTDPSEIIVGIDLGTTYSCISCYRNGQVEIFDDGLGNKTVPSYVAFTESEFLVGQPAKDQAANNPENTIYDVKRIIGRSFNDPELQRDLKLWPFSVIVNPQDNTSPMIQAEFQGALRNFHPEQISALLLKRLRQMAETRLGHPVKKAVITVPAYFTDQQRTATVSAGKIAGLEVVKILNEPTAAAFAYGTKNPSTDKRNILVFDLGGGTFDVSLVEVIGREFNVKSTSGDAHFGGEDFESTMIRFLSHKFKQTTQIDIENMPGPLRKLKRACEHAKIQLSSGLKADIHIEQIIPGHDLDFELTRSRFEQLCQKSFKLSLPPIDEVLQQSGLTKDNIDSVVLVGGSTRIPAIQQLVTDYFNGKVPSQGINPDEAVSQGAAIQAAVLSKHVDQQLDNVVIQDVIPFDLGIRLASGAFSPIIPRGSQVPSSATKTYYTHMDNQPMIKVLVLEGLSKQSDENNVIGDVILRDLPQLPAGQVSCDVSLIYDSNAILSCDAVINVNGTPQEEKAVISFPKRSTIDHEEVDRLRSEAARMEEEQRRRIEQLQGQLGDAHKAREELRQIIQGIIKMIREAGPEVLSDAKGASGLLLKIMELLNQLGDDCNFDIEQIRKLQKDINRDWDEIIKEIKKVQKEKGLVPEHLRDQ